MTENFLIQNLGSSEDYILYENNSYGIDSAYAYRKIIDLALFQCTGTVEFIKWNYISHLFWKSVLNKQLISGVKAYNQWNYISHLNSE
jgi:hypothetical protein